MSASVDAASIKNGMAFHVSAAEVVQISPMSADLALLALLQTPTERLASVEWAQFMMKHHLDA